METISGLEVASLNGASVDWTVNVPPGLYTVSVYAGNAHGQSPTFWDALIVLLPPDVGASWPEKLRQAVPNAVANDPSV